jgi:hypothetical protein
LIANPKKMMNGFCRCGHGFGLWYTYNMNPARCHKPFRFLKALGIATWAVVGIHLSAPALSASETPLDLSTKSHVNDDGKVTIALTLKNSGRQSLFHIHPMFHFHHTMSPMPMIDRLDPGQSVTLENKKHPDVWLVGSYPVVARVSYKETEKAEEFRTSMHIDSFYFEEPKVSQIEGDLVAEVGEDSSHFRISLKNPSPAFKNIRMMLLLPPELSADRFQGMKGFTMRAGEEKSFEVPVRKTSGPPGGVFPVHLLVEYGGMQRHYSGDIRGEINFGPMTGQGAFWPQMLVFVFLAGTLWLALSRRFSIFQSA